MNYIENRTALAQYAGDSGYETDPDFLAQLPVFIRSAELRILRDLDLLNTRITDTSAALIPNNRRFILPTDQGSYQIVETVALRMSYAQDITGTLFTQPPLQWVTKEFLDAAYPDDHAIGAPSVPVYIAPYTETEYAVGPAAGLAYPLTIYGVVWPATMTAQNNETYISVNLPDLFLAAEMIDVTMWEKQFGRTADEAQGATDWNAEYERIKGAANVVNLRQNIQGAGWGVNAPNPIAKAG